MLGVDISIHAPHEGVRHDGRKVIRPNSYFNPRTPRGGATLVRVVLPCSFEISIHAPHEGVRRWLIRIKSEGGIFQSTHPTRGCDVLDIFHVVVA